MTVTIYDWQDQEIKIGSKVIYGAADMDDPASVAQYTGTVVDISDPDADYDDELGRGVEITPRVKVRFANDVEERISTINITQISWMHYPDGPTDLEYSADDLEVVK